MYGLPFHHFHTPLVANGALHYHNDYIISNNIDTIVSDHHQLSGPYTWTLALNAPWVMNGSHHSIVSTQGWQLQVYYINMSLKFKYFS